MSKVSLAKEKIKILLLEGVHQSALETLKRNGYSNIDYVKTSLPEDELKNRIKDAHFVGIRSRSNLNENVLAAAEKLVAIGCFCIGTNQVDLAAAKKRGIAVLVTLGHLPFWILQRHNASTRLWDKWLRDSECRRMTVVESLRDIAAQLQVLTLIVSDRYRICVIK